MYFGVCLRICKGFVFCMGILDVPCLRGVKRTHKATHIKIKVLSVGVPGFSFIF